MNDIEALNNNIMDLFHGLVNGSVKFSYDKLHCAMKTNLCEVFSDAAEDFVMTVNAGKPVSKEQLQTLHDNLLAFGEDFNVKEAKALAKKAMALVDNPS